MKRRFIIAIALTFTPWVVNADFQRAVDAFEQGQMTQAKALFNEYQSNAEALVYLAKIAMADDLDEAEDWIDDAIDQQTDNAEAHYTRGIIMGRQASDAIFSALSYAKKSKNSFKRAVELEPKNVVYQMGLFQFYLQAPGIAGGDEEKAKAMVDTIAALDERQGWQARLSIAEQSDKGDEIESLLSQAKSAFPDSPVFFFKAGMYLQQKEQYGAALEQFSAAMSKTAQDDEEIRSRFAAQYQIGRTAGFGRIELEQGIKALRDYIEHAPSHRELPEKYWAQFRLANLYEISGEQQLAEQLYQQLADVPDKDLKKQLKKKI